MLAVLLIRLLLSPSGAIDRGAFAAGVGLLISAALGLNHALQGWAGPLGLGSFAFVLVFAWSALCLSRKRLHDFGWSGLAIPVFLGLYLLAAATAALLVDRTALASWQQTMAAFGLFGGPMVGWLIALAIIPSNDPAASAVRTTW